MDRLSLSDGSGSLAYEDVGQGPPLLLLHAFLLDRRMWHYQIEKLSDRFRVLAVDLPGFGGSPLLADIPTLDQIARILQGFLDQLGIPQKILLGGLSMGGYIALAFARAFPKRLRGLILANTSADPDSETARQYRDRLARILREGGVDGLLDALIGKVLAPGETPQQQKVRQQIQRIVRSQSTTALLQTLQMLRDRPDGNPFLPEIAVPTLVITSAADGIVPAAKSQAMAARIPCSRLVQIPGVGHVSNLEAPEHFQEALETFLKEFPELGAPWRAVGTIDFRNPDQIEAIDPAAGGIP